MNSDMPRETQKETPKEVQNTQRDLQKNMYGSQQSEATFRKGQGPNRTKSEANSRPANEDHLEGKATKAIEKQTAKIPSGFYLGLALGSMALSATFATLSKRKDMANFVGLWAPSFLMLGLYNKIVKTHGSDSQTPA